MTGQTFSLYVQTSSRLRDMWVAAAIKSFHLAGQTQQDRLELAFGGKNGHHAAHATFLDGLIP